MTDTPTIDPIEVSLSQQDAVAHTLAQIVADIERRYDAFLGVTVDGGAFAPLDLCKDARRALTEAGHAALLPPAFHDSVQCHRCRKNMNPDDGVEWQERLSWRNTGGYGSVFGDGSMVELTLCQVCVREVLGPFLHYADPA